MNKNDKPTGKSYKTLFVFPITIVIIALSLFVFDVYKVASSSMEPTLFHDDILLIRRFHHSKKPNCQLQLSHTVKIKKNDILVFRYPQNYLSNRATSGSSPTYLVKKCIGLPGDTVVTPIYLFDGDSYANSIVAGSKANNNSSYDIFKKKTQTIVVPVRNSIVNSTIPTGDITQNILNCETIPYKISGEKIILPDRNEYYYKHNYYFVIGENESGSIDSRTFGPIPEFAILGKVILVFHRRHLSK